VIEGLSCFSAVAFVLWLEMGLTFGNGDDLRGLGIIKWSRHRGNPSFLKRKLRNDFNNFSKRPKNYTVLDYRRPLSSCCPTWCCSPISVSDLPSPTNSPALVVLIPIVVRALTLNLLFVVDLLSLVVVLPVVSQLLVAILIFFVAVLLVGLHLINPHTNKKDIWKHTSPICKKRF